MKNTRIFALIIALVSLLTLTACGGTTPAPSSSPSASPSAPANTDAANLADTLTFAQGAEPRGLDPALVDDGESSKVIVNIYEGLLKYAKDSTALEPCLATSWKVSDDGLTYTFELRQGVKFQDGTDFNAEAVKYNIERQMPGNATTDMTYADFVYGYVTKVEAPDTYTVVVTLKDKNTPFLSNLAMSMAAPMVSPKALQENNGSVMEKPVGTGPYSFDRWDKGQDVVLVRNDNYWGDKAKTQNVIFRFISDNSARVVALTNGEVDMIDGIDATVIDQLKSAGMTVDQPDGMNTNYMAYNVDSPIFSNAENRKAVSEAVNVPELVQSLYQGYASPADTILPSFVPGFSSDIKQVAYNPDDAKTILSKNGVTAVHIITYSNVRPYNTANGDVLATAIQGYLSKVNVTATIDSYDWTTYKEKVKAGDFDIAFYGWTGDNGDPDNFMSLLSDKDPAMNISRFNDPTYLELINKGKTTPNGDDRNAIYKQLEQIQVDQNPWLLVSHSKLLSAYSPKIQDYYYHVTGNVFLSQMTKLK
ncbi:peptide/nickel transport system substrate-binding protein [Sporobacter termitidis DSM 10068]|uniref:Peptide/nickel transport system substrate-binding protein n=1 Tax=Sporobacter termitidis DSM 10068 TaxID=1123282 RepID=A0A1M5Z255_9FIRM|nr:ABC transporter substrate-binding protein [Sporobacter termitidis]SHI18224.1 peptide/nickel transport system substrate-binding protein [Sporobacter termitidis DSM 10068]